MIAVIDYGVGNLFSVSKAVEASGATVEVTGDPDRIRAAEKLILPGVGAFGDCMKNLRAAGLDGVILEEIGRGTPLMGICVGLQILFEGSEESPNVAGLGVFKGVVRKIRAEGLKVPHMGWNSIAVAADNPSAEKYFIPPARPQQFSTVNDSRSYFYFVHSYHAVPEDRTLIAATTDYGEKLTAAVARDNIFAVQFHPEKSGDVGLQLLKNFVGRA